MRFFIALEISDTNRAKLQSLQSKLHTLIPQLNITYPQKLHVTIAFIGDQKDEIKDSLIQVLQQAAKGIAPFEVSPAYIDGFPNIHIPDVLWMGIKGDIDKLFILHERIKDGLKHLQLPVDERRFIPHITIAKWPEPYRISDDLELEIEQLGSSIHFDPIKVTGIKLFESIPDQGFHHHNTLAEIKLEG